MLVKTSVLHLRRQPSHRVRAEGAIFVVGVVADADIINIHQDMQILLHGCWLELNPRRLCQVAFASSVLSQFSGGWSNAVTRRMIIGGLRRGRCGSTTKTIVCRVTLPSSHFQSSPFCYRVCCSHVWCSLFVVWSLVLYLFVVVVFVLHLFPCVVFPKPFGFC